MDPVDIAIYLSPTPSAVELKLQAFQRRFNHSFRKPDGKPIAWSEYPSYDAREVMKRFARVVPPPKIKNKRWSGARALTRALMAVGHPRNYATVFKWGYPRPRGTGGHLPQQAVNDIKVAAERFGIDLADCPLIWGVKKRGPKGGRKRRGVKREAPDAK